jgi:hypothetical protein
MWISLFTVLRLSLGSVAVYDEVNLLRWVSVCYEGVADEL